VTKDGRMSKDKTVEFMWQGELWAVEYKDDTHAYYLHDPSTGRRRVPSASTISKVEYSDPGGYMRWASNETKEGREWTASRDQAAEWGTAAHNQLEHLALHEKSLTLTDQPEHVRGCVQGVASWWMKYRPKFIASEVVVCSPTMRVAGRFDFIAEVRDELVLGDLKSSKACSWDEWARNKAKPAFIQMAGYSLMYAECNLNLPLPTSRYVLRVAADGHWDWEKDYAPEESEAAFIANLASYDRGKDWNKAYKVNREVAVREALAA
jgi:hypothetical protein